MAVPIPNIVQPFVDPKTGIITQAWRQYLLNLGVSSSSDIDVIVAFLEGMTFTDPEARAEAIAAQLFALTGRDPVDATARRMAQDALLMALRPAQESESLDVQDEGVTVAADTTVINFTGDGVTATQTAPGVVEVAISGVSWIPLVDGAEPPGFITDGAGVLILVAYP